MPTACETWVFHGRVQGVGFRATVATIAKHYPVNGYVKNLDDGTVLVVAEGEEKTIRSFRGAIQNALAAYIREVVDGEACPVRAFGPGFEIRYD